MKQLLVLLLTITLFTACKNNKDPRLVNEKGGGWSAAEKEKGLKLCMDEVDGKIDQEQARKYCSCVLEKTIEKYPTFAEADKGTEADGIKFAQSCMQELQGGGGLGGDVDDPGKKKGGGLFGGVDGWSSTDKQRYLNECVPSAANSGVDQQTANTYCECTLKKMEKKFKSYSDAQNKMTRDDLATIQQECAQQQQGEDN